MIRRRGEFIEDLHSSSYFTSDPFPFPILEPVPASNFPSSTPPLDLSQLPATIDTIFLSDQYSPNPHHGYQPSHLSPQSPCLVFPHPQPKSPFPEKGSLLQNELNDYRPPSPQSIASATMQELTQLSPDLAWDNLPDDPNFYTHQNIQNCQYPLYDTLPENDTMHQPQDILSSALVLNDITYDIGNNFENFENPEFLLQSHYEDRYQINTEDFSKR
jgi:hypothetical protein